MNGSFIESHIFAFDNLVFFNRVRKNLSRTVEVRHRDVFPELSFSTVFGVPVSAAHRNSDIFPVRHRETSY